MNKDFRTRVVFDLTEDMRQAWIKTLKGYHEKISWGEVFLVIHNVYRMMMKDMINKMSLSRMDTTVISNVLEMAKTKVVSCLTVLLSEQGQTTRLCDAGCGQRAEIPFGKIQICSKCLIAWSKLAAHVNQIRHLQQRE